MELLSPGSISAVQSFPLTFICIFRWNVEKNARIMEINLT
jgi:hypothetical protein